jgi:flavin-dependent dehydrogenase
MRAVVLGAGPAGCAAAISLRQAGVGVTSLEPAEFPRYRPGETLHPGVEPLLERLGALGRVLDAGYLRHAGTWVQWADSNRFVPFGVDDAGPWRGYQATRGDFDARLLETARDAGAEVLRSTPRSVLRDGSGRVIGVTTDLQRLCADHVIDCTGSARWLSRQLGIRCVCRSPRLVARYGYARGPVPGDWPRIESDRDGWTWLAQVAPRRMHWTRVTEPVHRPRGAWVPEALASLAHEPPSGADVTWRLAHQTAGPGWLLAGDAAAVLDPSSSHGVLRALMTGMMAAHMIARGTDDGYDDWLSSWFEHDATHMRLAYREAHLFGA